MSFVKLVLFFLRGILKDIVDFWKEYFFEFCRVNCCFDLIFFENELIESGWWYVDDVFFKVIELWSEFIFLMLLVNNRDCKDENGC